MTYWGVNLFIFIRETWFIEYVMLLWLDLYYSNHTLIEAFEGSVHINNTVSSEISYFPMSLLI
jgi:hypothetical protein